MLLASIRLKILPGSQKLGIKKESIPRILRISDVEDREPVIVDAVARRGVQTQEVDESAVAAECARCAAARGPEEEIAGDEREKGP